MAVTRKWQEELVVIAWINISLVVMSLPLFSIYIMESLQGEDAENFVLHTERGQHFVEVILKYFAAILFWIPLSILLKVGASKSSFTLMKICSVGNLIFIFLLALQLIIEPPESIIVVCAYAITFIYLVTTVWLMNEFIEGMKADKMGDMTPVLPPLNDNLDNNFSSENNLDELNDVADQRYVFRLQPLPLSRGPT